MTIFLPRIKNFVSLAYIIGSNKFDAAVNHLYKTRAELGIATQDLNFRVQYGILIFNQIFFRSFA